MAEDKAQLTNLQRGLGARSFQPGPLGPPDVEGTVWDFYRYMARRLGRGAFGAPADDTGDASSNRTSLL